MHTFNSLSSYTLYVYLFPNAISINPPAKTEKQQAAGKEQNTENTENKGQKAAL